MPLRPHLTVVLPARNEAAIIEATVRSVVDYLDALEASYEVIVGDSGSTDGTGRRVVELGIPNVRVVREDRPGKGRILSRCFREAHGRIVGFLDADLEIPVDGLGALLAAMTDDVDVVVANKVDAEGRALHRRLMTRSINAAIRLLFGTSLGDHQAGCKVFRKEVVAPALPLVRSHGWLWDAEVLVQVRWRGGRTKEVPVPLRSVRRSRLSVTTMLISLGELFAFRVRTLRFVRATERPWARPEEVAATPWVG